MDIYCCSQTCAGVAAAKTKKAIGLIPKAPKPRAFICDACGKVAQGPSNLPHQRYCSHTCKKRGVGNYRRRCRKYGVPFEPGIKPHEIHERDGWRCHICGSEVRRNWAVWAHPLAPTLDHVVPLSAPGSPGHVRSNVATACFACNTAKGNRGGGEQLALVG